MPAVVDDARVKPMNDGSRITTAGIGIY